MTRHCGNQRLEERLTEAIERGEISEQEARQIYREQQEEGGYEGIESYDEDN